MAKKKKDSGLVTLAEAIQEAVQIAEAVQAVGRITTIGPDAMSSMEPAPPPLPGPEIVLPAPDMALRVLGELGVMSDKAQALLEKYEDLKERTRTARAKYDEAAEAVITRLRQATHASPLPLFDQEQRESDQARMEEAANASLDLALPPVDAAAAF
jgi:hypothetical protein